MKYNVKLDFCKYVDDVEADSEEDAIKQALIEVTNNPYDYFTAEDEIANKIQETFWDYSYASLVEEEVE